jgi:GT2 family glycosyltransferase
MALDENVGFGAANNLAMAEAPGRLFLLLNSDARLQGEEDLRVMVEALDSDLGVGVLGPRLENAEEVLEYSARRFPTVTEELLRRYQLFRLLPGAERARRFLLEFFDHRARTEADWITGACMLVRREAYEAVGGFDPDIFMYGEEREWCWRIREAGFGIVFDPRITVIHARGASSPGRAVWRIRQGFKADLQFARERGGRLYQIAFWLVRLGGLVVEAVLFGLSSFLGRGGAMSERARAARLELKSWVSLPVGRDG